MFEKVQGSCQIEGFKIESAYAEFWYAFLTEYNVVRQPAECC